MLFYCLCNKFNNLNEAGLIVYCRTDHAVRSERIFMSFIRETHSLDGIQKLSRAPFMSQEQTIKWKHFKIRKLILRLSIIKVYKLKMFKKVINIKILHRQKHCVHAHFSTLIEWKREKTECSLRYQSRDRSTCCWTVCIPQRCSAHSLKEGRQTFIVRHVGSGASASIQVRLASASSDGRQLAPPTVTSKNGLVRAIPGAFSSHVAHFVPSPPDPVSHHGPEEAESQGFPLTWKCMSCFYESKSRYRHPRMGEPALVMKKLQCKLYSCDVLLLLFRDPTEVSW